MGLLAICLGFLQSASAQDTVPPPAQLQGSSVQSTIREGFRATAKAPVGESNSISAANAKGTAVGLPSELTRLYEKGGTPRSLEELRLLEAQHQRIASAAEACTVSVKIGPAEGCGVIITDTGFILTAAHVAMRPGKVAIVTLPGGRRVTATTHGMNRNVDAGLIKINANQNEGRPWPHASLGSSDHLVSGMWCVATGHPGGYSDRRGFVTRVGRILSVRKDALVTDCALIGGDSGGPLFDLAGKLIAIHSRIGNDVADNLHVPVVHYDLSWDRLVSSQAWGYLPGFKPVLGVSGNQTSNVAEIVSVTTGSPAADAGFLEHDIVEEFGDVMITDFESLKRAVADTMPGERAVVWVNRGGQRVKLFVEIGRAD